MQPRGTKSAHAHAHADGAGTRALSCHLRLAHSHPFIHPIHEPARSLSAPPRRACAGAGARDCVCMGDVGGDAPQHHQGEIAPRGHRTTSVIHVCKWRDIQTCIVLCMDLCWELYMHVCICVYCVSRLCAHSTSYLHTCIAWLRLPKERKHWRACRATSS